MTYELMLDLLDEGRLPVAIPVAPGECFHASYRVASWSSVCDSDPWVRMDGLMLAMIYTRQVATGEHSEADSASA